MIKVELLLCCDEPGCTMCAKVLASLGADGKLKKDDDSIPAGWRIRSALNEPQEMGDPRLFCVCPTHSDYRKDLNYADS